MATILIIDDHAANREYLVTLLGYSGHRLLQAADGVEGLATALAEKPDLVIADILMPTMDGFEFVRRLRADPEIADTPVIFYTAHFHEREAKTLAAECGVSYVLTKPAEPETVLQTVESALGAVPPPAPTPPNESFDREHLRLLTDKLSEKADELTSANGRLAALVDLGIHLGSERQPMRLTQSFCEAAREIIGARFAFVGVLRPERMEARFSAVSGIDPESVKKISALDYRQDPLATVFAEGRSIRTHLGEAEWSGYGLTEERAPFESLLVVPIVSPARTYGWLCLVDRVGAEGFSEEDERLAGILGAQFGRIYENGSLYADLVEQTVALKEEIQERQRIEAALRQSEELFRTLCDAAPISIYRADAAGNVVYTNPRWQTLTGLTAEESMGEGWSRADHPEDRERVLHEWREAIREGREFRAECRMLSATGEIRWVRGRAAPIRSNHRGLTGFVGTIEDFTERKLAEDASRAAQARLEHVVASSPAVLYSLAGEGAELIPTWISPNVMDLLGYSPEEALSPSWWYDCIHPDDRDQTIRSIAEGLAANDRIAIDYRLRRHDGDYVWLRGEMRLLRDGQGKQLEILGSWTDITSRVEAEQALAERARIASLGAEIGQWLTQARDVRDTLRDCAQSVVNHLDAAFARVWTVDATGEVLELQASAGMYTHLDGPHARIPVGSFKIGKIAAERRPHLTNSVIGDPQVSDQEWAEREGMVAFAGYPLVVEDRLVGVLALFARHPLSQATLDALGRVSGEIAIGIERKRAEENLQKANALLEDALSELRRAQSKIVEQERLRALGEMASGIAHDFNNALSPIVGFSDLLLEHPASLDNRETLISYLQIIRTAASDAASVVRRLREFYRGREATDVLTAVDLNALVRQSIELSRPRWRDQAQSRGATIEMTTDLAKIPMVSGDAAHLREAVMNLIFNAVDAMPEGGQVRLRTYSSKNGGPTLEVSDTGTGMSEEVRQRCLQPFFTTKGESGTGLGLSMVYGIIQRHDGALDIRSAPGEGTTIAMTLPRHQGGGTLAQSKKAGSEIPSLRVLVVDDETSVRTATVAMLRADGHQVTEATNGVEALALMPEHTFDLVVTDRAMPGMSGDQLAVSIHNLYPGTPVVMLTGFGDLMYSTGDLPQVVRVVVSKPVTVPILREAVRKVM